MDPGRERNACRRAHVHGRPALRRDGGREARGEDGCAGPCARRTRVDDGRGPIVEKPRDETTSSVAKKKRREAREKKHRGEPWRTDTSPRTARAGRRRPGTPKDYCGYCGTESTSLMRFTDTAETASSSSASPASTLAAPTAAHVQRGDSPSRRIHRPRVRHPGRGRRLLQPPHVTARAPRARRFPARPPPPADAAAPAARERTDCSPRARGRGRGRREIRRARAGVNTNPSPAPSSIRPPFALCSAIAAAKRARRVRSDAEPAAAATTPLARAEFFAAAEVFAAVQLDVPHVLVLDGDSAHWAEVRRCRVLPLRRARGRVVRAPLALASAAAAARASATTSRSSFRGNSGNTA